MGYLVKNQHFVTCDVCQRVGTSDGQKSDEETLEFALAHDWASLPGIPRSRVGSDLWHVCPQCRHSQEFHTGLPAAKTLIAGGMDLRWTWTSVNALVMAGLIVESPDESA